MANSSKLGRGLDILLGQTADNSQSDNNLKTLDVDKLQRGKFQPREEINPDTLNELANSITAQGIIQPLVARKITYDKYEIIAGERRWRAAKIAGLTKVPVIVRNINDKVALAIGLIENIQRESLTPLEEAKALRQLIEDFKMTHEEISQVVGRSRSSVSNLIRLLRLSNAVKQFLSNGDIEMGHGRALLSLEDEQQFEVASQVIQKSLSVRQTEELVKRVLNPKPSKSNAVDPRIELLIKSLSKKLDSKTEIKANGDKGRIIIHYQSEDELDAILKRINQ
ncbi:Chromosome (plasmid) partitioning protein ParB [Bathymodiolus heckerae thiotrophic gill symbiont]|uniref:ParB/RepB/Spo0J family partition protein n=1 Tax=Bathymodiolus heckerae thiotrophic gill symbiont TaxID=1052212 RepID=UPI0010B09566|nr:ParB/RepB/Spo0J family partition protein [Bathymodiolus heckerae thiotrophic gill symbiont]CAC9434055.1 Chromosome (plasmid) partitioning protein ParB [uncultured Gammaproteobacteria bacterium]SMN13644.1 Chromosome (plasmid) partitioning protein ParB [Bathymodiolus heckerae thiotrophic gill symbiont]SMN15687.1 Chromosome (plasmid) partitioning protein ParB [uncultured Candidatus Thioglobus sp.]